MIYYILFIFFAILCLISIKYNYKERERLLFLSVGVILCFQSFRWRTGTDWANYLYEFNHVDIKGNTDSFEPGFRLLNYLVRQLTDSYTIFLFIECGINLFFIIWFIRMWKPSNPMIVLLYMFSCVIFPIRFTIATNIILCTYKYIYHRRFIPFLLLVLLATSIHRTSIFFLPFYFIIRRKINSFWLVSIYISGIILGQIANIMFGSIFGLANLIYGHVTENYQNKMDAYLVHDIPEYGKMSPLRFLLSLINSTFFVLFFVYFRNRFFIESKIYNLFLNLYIVGISFNRMIFQLIPDLARLTQFFSGGFILMTLMIISKFKKDQRTILILFVILYIFFLYRSSIHGIYEDLFLPYYSIFSNKERSFVY